jgi:hypothetical protein
MLHEHRRHFFSSNLGHRFASNPSAHKMKEDICTSKLGYRGIQYALGGRIQAGLNLRQLKVSGFYPGSARVSTLRVFPRWY